MRPVAATLSLALLLGCAGTSSIQRTLQRRQGDLLYLHDFAPPERRSGTVGLTSFAAPALLPPETTVERTSSFVLPLLLLNLWTHGYRATLGTPQIRGDLEQALREALVEDLRRGSRLAYVEGAGDVTLDVRVEEAMVLSPSVKTGSFYLIPIGTFALVGGAGSGYHTGRTEAVLRATLIAKRAGTEVLNRSIRAQALVSMPRWRSPRIDDHTILMIEALSLAARDLNRRIVEEVDGLAP